MTAAGIVVAVLGARRDSGELLIAGAAVLSVFGMIFLVPVVGDFRSRQIGVFTGSVLTMIVAYASVLWLDAATRRSLLLAGLLWRMLTIACYTNQKQYNSAFQI